MTSPPSSEPARPSSPLPIIDSSVFLRQMQIVTCGVLLLVLVIYLLEKFRDILQPLFVALFVGFLMHPIHRWLIQRGIRSLLAYVVIVVLVMLVFFGLGSMLYRNIAHVSERLPGYENRLETMVRDVAKRLPFATPGLEGHFLRAVDITPEWLMSATTDALGRFGDFTSLAALTFVYLLFLVAEKVSFPRRLALAFGELQGARIMGVVDSIHQAIGAYIAVKTFVSALAGLLSYLVLALFGVDFAATWGILIFVLNYIPYLGSLVALALPILLSLVQFDEMWKPAAITLLLVAIQQVIGILIEPRLAGHRLDISPLLILLSLAFWGFIWGIVGMILAVPLLVIVRIILDNIQETKPLATLISNR